MSWPLPSMSDLLGAPSASSSRRMMAVSTPAVSAVSGLASSMFNGVGGIPVLQPPYSQLAAAMSSSPSTLVLTGTPVVNVPTTQADEEQQLEVPLPPSRLATDVNQRWRVYRAQVMAYLHRFNAWGLVDGSIQRPVVEGGPQQH
ncbi:hypothetical protein PC129_g5030 [Phytophthora cactorum]|uniref:Uncharacterized protein n=1 Tax=Phytophthora cactorum TaxID=29920 RepID=A0A329SBH3_9STRA|nr:hypothetical protein Pcac1_g27600 [Phytophthora cactorum]KAG2831363.1 hypothetical protein PC112_g7299 [Phytophthora cactorum]KAG2916637.1 hypothetical protein PC114_g7409 [Phytophthora cactorum]KAG2947204.1 hypothetical protein PC117_g6992 [Phytophthora cactorum]KAG3025354.1 hypothetical protein PC120_g6528 [Phytophthora cactorum]